MPESVPVLGNCMTEDGWAQWNGSCVLGQAEGEGVATYEDSFIATIEGSFEAGVPQGEAVITYSSGASYRGSLKDGEYHGFGTVTEGWGGTYAGNWDKGFRNGRGTFTPHNGQPVEGVWERGRLIGGWYSDARSGCEVWWAGNGSDPVGVLTWDGACSDGRASGFGVIRWTDETPEAVSGSTIAFTGVLVGGKLNGEGVWEQTDRYVNVIHQTVRQGTWIDGVREGYGTDGQTSEFLDGSFLGAVDTYEGGWENGRYSGQGERVDSKTYSDGGIESFTEQGTFVEGTMREGLTIRQRNVAEGEDSTETISGRFSDRQYIGFGTIMTRNRSEDGYNRAIITNDGPVAEGGSGIVEYANGDVFIGEFAYYMGGGVPSEGFCMFPSVSFMGSCRSVFVQTAISSRHFQPFDFRTIGEKVANDADWRRRSVFKGHF